MRTLKNPQGIAAWSRGYACFVAFHEISFAQARQYAARCRKLETERILSGDFRSSGDASGFR
jgi:hypothetical protein